MRGELRDANIVILNSIVIELNSLFFWHFGVLLPYQVLRHHRYFHLLSVPGEGLRAFVLLNCDEKYEKSEHLTCAAANTGQETVKGGAERQTGIAAWLRSAWRCFAEWVQPDLLYESGGAT